ncbi:MAG: TFIIB-type zinc ribbon-containing protein [Ruminococcaceae bacterium]|nr:TFIIB-type zinc ribbon-containing protein [Oscillospiraceae bacterium]
MDEYKVADTMNETDRKCPSCGGTMDFDPATGDLGCPYCGWHEAVESEEETRSAAELRFEDAENYENCDWGAEKKTVVCKSCGAETVYDALEIAGECPYCGSNQVMEAQDAKTMAPGGVVPFKITKKQAGEKFIKWIKGRLFTPRKAKKQAKPDAFKGIYLPYWTFDTDTHSTYTARYGIDIHYKDRNGNVRTRTHWHFTSGMYDKFINDQLARATDRHDTDLLSKIATFDTESNVEYKPEYLAGYASERYSIGLKDAWENDAKKAIRRGLEYEIDRHIRITRHADHVAGLMIKTNYNDITFKYLLLPIWISSFKYKDKVYGFVVNGQNGHVGGRAPISALRVAIAIVLGITAVGLLWYLFSNV